MNNLELVFVTILSTWTFHSTTTDQVPWLQWCRIVTQFQFSSRDVGGGGLEKETWMAWHLLGFNSPFREIIKVTLNWSGTTREKVLSKCQVIHHSTYFQQLLPASFAASLMTIWMPIGPNFWDPLLTVAKEVTNPAYNGSTDSNIDDLNNQKNGMVNKIKRLRKIEVKFI